MIENNIFNYRTRALDREGKKEKCVEERRVYCQNYPITNCNKIVKYDSVPEIESNNAKRD